MGRREFIDFEYDELGQRMVRVVGMFEGAKIDRFGNPYLTSESGDREFRAKVRPGRDIDYELSLDVKSFSGGWLQLFGVRLMENGV
jgi:hypothetical protein